ncbi:uncharacterized protein LOC125704124 [Brienomyrus brachyistius]|uniref:uncharacterized protein LOC125704124 n=1 Tax=Brienomyrus brachyistius TaxID=42636 RepID=UPI0020B30E4D|nr:uncharacterized protein LOC125704124 [Brienomyrus brachyistius]
MISTGLWILELAIFLVQVFTFGSCEEVTRCTPGFSEQFYWFKADQKYLDKGRRLGRVLYDDCSGRQRFLFNSADSRFKVESDGTVLIKRPVTLHEGHKSFFVHAWDSVGRKVTARVRVQLEPQTSHVLLGVENVPAEQSDGSESVPELVFSRRIKREWVIPPVTILEGQMGPFPKFVVRIRSSKDKEVVMQYWITGPGADEPPKNIFTMERTSGQLFVTQPLDREKCSNYTLLAHAAAVGSTLTKEDPMEVVITVGDQNDNKPVFTQDVYMGSVPEAVGEGYEILSVTATDADDPETSNAALKYSIISQDPPLPVPDMFAINPTSGLIRLNNGQLDKKKHPQYSLTVQVGDMMGNGYLVTCKAIITVTDSNDNAPQFDPQTYEVSVPENQKDTEVVKLSVNDADDPETPAWFTKFKIIQGNDGNVFNVSTAPGGLDGIVTLIKELDFEKKNKYTLLVTVENEAPFAIRLPTATGTVVVNVEDRNEPPVFSPREKHVSVEESLAVNEIVAQYTATDPDTHMKQTIEYKMVPDQLGWLAINKTTGYVTVKSKMDREESSLVDGKYKALVLAIDNGAPPTTGTGTLIVELKDVNDNAPTIDQRDIRICNKNPEPVLLSVSDKDGPQFGPPFRVELRDKSNNNWTARMNESSTGIILTLKEQLPRDKYNVVLRLFDSQNLYQDNTLVADVCDCTGKDISCDDKYVAGLELPGILGILAAILLLLLLVLLLLMFLRRRTRAKEEPLLQDDIRDNIYYYDEEGGGEEDQDYDLSQIHRGLDNRPDVFRNDVAPTFLAAPQYRPRPANPEDIGNFIDDNLKAADTDPTAPPYDSLLVFDYEGGGSDAGSLSSLNSSSSGEDQDYNCLNEWGPRFKKLADMYGGGEEDTDLIMRMWMLGVILSLVQVFTFGSCEEVTPCSPGFSEQFYLFKADQKYLDKGRRLGRVLYDDCSGRQRFLFNSADSRFKVESDGTVLIKRSVTLHEGHKSFFVHAWDSVGKKVTARVRVQLEPQTSHVLLGVENVPAEQSDGSESVPELVFPRSSAGLRRRKREWVIPPITILEGQMGPYPKFVVRIRSSKDKEVVMQYWITGPGADEAPKNIFTMERTSGQLYVTQPLDREKCSSYTLLAHAAAVGSALTKEDPMEFIITVGDKNDNKPVFTQDVYMGSVPEAVGEGYEILSVTATDADDPETSNAALKYSIISQDPPLPVPDMFAINPTSGLIRLNNGQLDKKKHPQYSLTVQVGDMMGNGYLVTCKAIITVTDSNDNAPQFDPQTYEVSVPENQKDTEVVKLSVNDADDPETPAWFTKFKIIQGNDGNVFNVSTAPGGLDGIVTLIKELDFEKKNKYTLLVTVENEAPFAIRLPTATGTVVVNVEDRNEPPVFNPREKHVSVEESLAVNEIVAQYTATDPDTHMKQTIEYKMVPDQLGWLAINKTTGYVTVKSKMDREESSLVDGKYKALVLAIDNGAPPTTGTGTLIVELKDVNDNAPTIDQRDIRICNKNPEPVLLSVSDKDGPQFGPPFRVELRDKSNNNWTARMNESSTGIILTLKEQLPRDKYNVVLRLFDSQNLYQDNTLVADVCDCTGKDISCDDKYVAGLELPGILGILAAILLLLLLVLLLLMFLRRRTRVKKEPLLQDDDIRDNIYYYDEEGGGEEDQDYDLSQIHRGLDNRPDVFRNDVAPTFLAAPQYRPRPANPEDIGNFIDDNLKAADTDPTAPPYDSLLVFDYEGGGSDAGSLSSLNSSSSGEDQDYNCLNEWGPRFKKLADMYGGGEED